MTTLALDVGVCLTFLTDKLEQIHLKHCVAWENKVALKKNYLNLTTIERIVTTLSIGCVQGTGTSN